MGTCINHNSKKIDSKRVISLSELNIVFCKKQINSTASVRQEMFKLKDLNAPKLKLTENFLWNRRIQLRKIREMSCNE